MIVEAVRLLITLTFTAMGFSIGGSFGGEVLGAVVGAGSGYVLGGGFGRLVRRALKLAPKAIAPSKTGAEILAGSIGFTVGMLIGLVLSIPLIVFLPELYAWPLAALIVLLVAAFGGRLFIARSQGMLGSVGLRAKTPLPSHSLGAEMRSYVLDSSAAIDGRIFDLARSGLLNGRHWLPEFVIDELQALADSAVDTRRRRGRRGLDVLEILRDVPGIELAVLEATVPEFEEVDAKLLAVAEQTAAILLTTDANLAQAASLRGIEVLNPMSLGESLRGEAAVGDVVSVTVERVGNEEGQGVGYLNDGTMVVIQNAESLVGQTVHVEISNSLRTRVGRMLFARPAA
jgi:uncharacterized protein YacL